MAINVTFSAVDTDSIQFVAGNYSALLPTKLLRDIFTGGPNEAKLLFKIAKTLDAAGVTAITPANWAAVRSGILAATITWDT